MLGLSYSAVGTENKEIDLLLDLYIGIVKLQEYCKQKRRLNEVCRCKEIITHLFSLLDKLTTFNGQVKPNKFEAGRVVDKIISELAYFHPESQSEGHKYISDNLDKRNYQ